MLYKIIQLKNEKVIQFLQLAFEVSKKDYPILDAHNQPTLKKKFT